MHVFSVKLQPRKMQFDPMNYGVFEERQSASRDAYKPNGFNGFGCIFCKITLISLINDRFYKGSVAAFRRWQKYMFPQGMIRFSSIAKVHHRMLINIMVF